jgi:hypothetical protein
MQITIQVCLVYCLRRLFVTETQHDSVLQGHRQGLCVIKRKLNASYM